MDSPTTNPVVVGIDGSEEALAAALWAVGEAVGQGAPLRLLYVIRTDLRGSLSADQYRVAVQDGKAALRLARNAVEHSDDRIHVETDITQGNPAGVLEAESRNARMICLGSSGIGRAAMALLGSTAAGVAEQSWCPVAIVRSRGAANPLVDQSNWVMVPVSIFVDNELIEMAIEHARMLGWPVLAVGVWRPEFGDTPYASLDVLVAQWQRRHPDVHIQSVATAQDMSHFLRDNPDIGGLVVTDVANAEDVARLVGRGDRGADAQSARIVLVAHRRTELPETA